MCDYYYYQVNIICIYERVSIHVDMFTYFSANKSPVSSKRISDTRTVCPNRASVDDKENSSPTSRRANFVMSPECTTKAKSDVLEAKCTSTSDIDQLESKMSRAVLSAQRKQLFQKSFQVRSPVLRRCR